MVLTLSQSTIIILALLNQPTMQTKHQVHNLIMLDESGSMSSIKTSIIEGFNEVVQTIKGIEKQFPEQEHFITFVSFNGLGIKTLHAVDPVKKLKEINAKTYNPDAMTPLYDAMGLSINTLKKALEGQTDYNVLVTVLTDGEENASVEFSGNDIKALIDELKLARWTFTYIGTDHDIDKFAVSISIENTLYFKKNEKDIKGMFFKEQKARFRYSQKINNNDDTQLNYFDDEDDAKDDAKANTKANTKDTTNAK